MFKYNDQRIEEVDCAISRCRNLKFVGAFDLWPGREFLLSDENRYFLLRQNAGGGPLKMVSTDRAKAFLSCVDLKRSSTFRIWGSLFNQEISYDGTYWNDDLGHADENDKSSFWVVCTNFCIEVLVGFDEIKEVSKAEAEGFWALDKIESREI